jgi:hypothetical protein
MGGSSHSHGSHGHSHAPSHGYVQFDGAAIEAVQKGNRFYSFLNRFPPQLRVAAGSAVVLAAATVVALGYAPNPRPVSTLNFDHASARREHRSQRWAFEFPDKETLPEPIQKIFK